MSCDHRFGLSVGLSGGVLRNILVSELKTSDNDVSFHNYLDPFGDIDIVLAGEETER
jgi:hypothetical protein